jgi:hypothetical protein
MIIDELNISRMRHNRCWMSTEASAAAIEAVKKIDLYRQDNLAKLLARVHVTQRLFSFFKP